ncbi:shikimate kinase [Methylorubrum extorquens]|uniref:Shikimate kinase n=1 Tax=Methylorubrum extorquens DSM 13060 TaxID=882800 RepID=H1KCJ0_METEX|nr:AAA family ATPase [Methylorubrum extorquens]EHP94814.1 hypothetical protein MetexDRAFT_0352 [Methylorubrum extorquens DSM 13060]
MAAEIEQRKSWADDVLLLIGASGVGKSTVAALQASLLGCCIIDLDQRFTEQFGHGQDAS